MGGSNGQKSKVNTRNLRAKQNSQGAGDDGRGMGLPSGACSDRGDKSIGVPGTAVEGQAFSDGHLSDPGLCARKREPESDRNGRRCSIRLRVNPSTHGGTLGLLIKKTERRKQSIRRSISILEDQIKALHIELDQETEDLQELKRLLANWQANIDRLREIREGELDYTEGSE